MTLCSACSVGRTGPRPSRRAALVHSILVRFAAEPVEFLLAGHPFGVEQPCSVSNPLGIGWATYWGRRLCCAIFEEARGRINLILFRRLARSNVMLGLALAFVFTTSVCDVVHRQNFVL